MNVKNKPLYITINNITKLHTDWSTSLGHGKNYFYNMNKKKGLEYTVNKIIKDIENGAKPLNEKRGKNEKLLTVNGQTHNYSQWGKIIGCSSCYIGSLVNQKGEDKATEFIQKRLKKLEQPGFTKEMFSSQVPQGITVQGRTQTAYKWSKEIGCAPNYISTLIKQKGLNYVINYIDEILSNDKPYSDKNPKNIVSKRITINGVSQSRKKWADTIGCSEGRIKRIIKKDGIDGAIKFIEYALEHKNDNSYKLGRQITVNGETHNGTEWSLIIGRNKCYINQVIKLKGFDAAVKIIEENLNNKGDN